VTARGSRFSALAQAVKERAATVAEEPSGELRGGAGISPPHAPPEGAGLHKPAVALGAIAEGLRERVARLETELSHAEGRNGELAAQLEAAKRAAAGAGEAIEEFVFLAPEAIADALPRDRLPSAFSGREFEELLADIRENGQNDAITVRPSTTGAGYEIAAGRRRLEACRQLGRQVLARIRPLDETAMLRVQFSENERREDISALERARWFAAVQSRLPGPQKELAAQFGLDPSTLSLYLRLARFPTEILDRLRDPRRLSILRARRLMEVVEAEHGALDRMVDALEAQARASASAGAPDPDDQIELLLRVAEGRAGTPGSSREPVPDRRHVVHRGRRIGTLTRNGGQWVFRFATSIGEEVVQELADRLGEFVAEAESKRAKGSS
jgi:ParB family chromosome partitioning protein